MFQENSRISLSICSNCAKFLCKFSLAFRAFEIKTPQQRYGGICRICRQPIWVSNGLGSWPRGSDSVRCHKSTHRCCIWMGKLTINHAPLISLRQTQIFCVLCLQCDANSANTLTGNRLLPQNSTPRHQNASRAELLVQYGWTENRAPFHIHGPPALSFSVLRRSFSGSLSLVSGPTKAVGRTKPNHVSSC